jgi:uncharacterized membrane protein (DUF4010 family)
MNLQHHVSRHTWIVITAAIAMFAFIDGGLTSLWAYYALAAAAGIASGVLFLRDAKKTYRDR